MKKWIARKLLELFGESEREMLLTELVKKHFNTIGEEDIFRIIDGVSTFEGRELGSDETDLIIAEVKQIQKMTTWKILEKEIMYRANEKMYLNSTDTFHLTMGKSWQYVFDVMNSKLKSIIKG